MDAYTSSDVCNIFRIDFERFNQWVKYGYIKPTIPAQGQGTKATYTFNDLVDVFIFKSLLSFGIKRKVASEYTTSIKGCIDLGETNYKPKTSWIYLTFEREPMILKVKEMVDKWEPYKKHYDASGNFKLKPGD